MQRGLEGFLLERLHQEAIAGIADAHISLPKSLTLVRFNLEDIHYLLFCTHILIARFDLCLMTHVLKS
jgi:hypothetical protein